MAQHGLILSLAIVDEQHGHRSDELYLALRTVMLKRRDARIVTISTAGADEGSALGELRRRALEQPEVTRDGPLTTARAAKLGLLRRGRGGPMSNYSARLALRPVACEHVRVQHLAP
jgi:hypothetical protein